MAAQMPWEVQSSKQKIVVDLGVDTYEDGDGKILTCHRWAERGDTEKQAEKEWFEAVGSRKKKFWSFYSQALEAEWDSPEEPGEDRGEAFCGEAGSDENGVYQEFVLYTNFSNEEQKKIDQEILRLSS